MADALEAEDTLQAKMFKAKMILAERCSDNFAGT